MRTLIGLGWAALCVGVMWVVLTEPWREGEDHTPAEASPFGPVTAGLVTPDEEPDPLAYLTAKADHDYLAWLERNAFRHQ